jgi:hypothetical protein
MILFGFDFGAIGGLFIGALSGAAIAAGGYLKTVDSGGLEPFDFEKFAITLVIGAAAGGYAAWTGTEYDAALTFLVAGGYTILVENWLKVIVRWVREWLQKPEA